SNFMKTFNPNKHLTLDESNPPDCFPILFDSPYSSLLVPDGFFDEESLVDLELMDVFCLSPYFPLIEEHHHKDSSHDHVCERHCTFKSQLRMKIFHT
nr:hypothetical protein [Tanacetum cinerariifolium]